MVNVYTDADLHSVCRQKKRILGVFWGITLFYAVFCLAFWIYFMSLPYADPMQTLPKALVFVATGAYVIFVFPFMGIKFGRVRRYYRMLYYLSEGMKNAEVNYFLCFEKKDLQKDYVDVNSCVFTTWNKKKNEWMEREAYFDMEKPLPDFEEGDLVRYVVQSNFIVCYDIVKRHAIEFEYEEDEDETNEPAETNETEESVATEPTQPTQPTQPTEEHLQ